MTKAWKQVPRLSHAPYPDVLVYRAVSDGRALQTGIQMMTADTVELPFDQLRPHGHYRVQERPGYILQSSSHGTLAISLQHQGRQSLALLPVE
jgi:hypothetical protein